MATTYQGWTNYETWVVGLWLDNEEGSYNYTRELANESTVEATTEQYLEAKHILADKLKAWLEESMPDLGGTLWADLLNAAFSEVEWTEIAENRLTETVASDTQNP